jgi:hypothetical protein
MDRSMLYFGIIMIAGFAAISQLKPYIPPGLEWVNFVLFMGVMFGGIGGLNYIYVIRTASNPYLGTLLRPENILLDLYIDVPQLEKRHLVGNLYNTLVELKFPQKILGYGESPIKRIEFVHEYEWEKRINFRPGDACLDDYDFKHPQTERIEVVRLPGKQMNLDRGEIIPQFKIISARNDYRLNFAGSTGAVGMPQSQKLDGGRDCANCPTVNELRNNLSQAMNDANNWHQQKIGLDQLVELKTVETAGLLDSKGGIKDFSIEYVLTHLSALGTFAKVKDYLMGSWTQRVGKWIVLGAVSCFAIFVVWQNPQWMNGVYLWANNPSNQIMVTVIIVSMILFAYFLLRRRS